MIAVILVIVAAFTLPTVLAILAETVKVTFQIVAEVIGWICRLVWWLAGLAASLAGWCWRRVMP